MRPDRKAPVLLVVGPSGSGKSSLARAGLMPQFGPFPDCSDRFLAANSSRAGDRSAPCLCATPLRRRLPLRSSAQGPQRTPEVLRCLGAAIGRTPPLRRSNGGSIAPQSAEQQKIRRRQAAGRHAPDRPRPVGNPAQQPATERGRPARPRSRGERDRRGSSPRSAAIATRIFSATPISSNCESGAPVRPASAGCQRNRRHREGARALAGLVFEERDGISLAKVISGGSQRCRCAALAADDAGAALRRARTEDTLTYAAYEAIGGLEGRHCVPCREGVRDRFAGRASRRSTPCYACLLPTSIRTDV